VTAPVFVLDDLGSVAPGHVVVLAGSEGRHAVSSLRLNAGEDVDLVDGRGRRAGGVIEAIDGDRVARVLIRDVSDESAPAPRVIVVQALPKGERGERAVELLTEVGVDVIVPWAARNCVTQWKGERAHRGHRKWLDAAHAAAKQSRRARFPEVTEVSSTADVIARVATADLVLLLHEEATDPIGSMALPAEGDILIIVGPEGGVSPDEVAALEAAGATSVQLGPTVLRTSSAGMAAVAVLLAQTARWGGRMRP
jgi:16S rRNA (uracil1498-N3)-methyltransferase